jgi:hypothetical protein
MVSIQTASSRSDWRRRRPAIHQVPDALGRAVDRTERMGTVRACAGRTRRFERHPDGTGHATGGIGPLPLSQQHADGPNRTCVTGKRREESILRVGADLRVAAPCSLITSMRIELKDGQGSRQVGRGRTWC